MPEPGPDAALPLCASADLAEAGPACVFDVLLWRRPARAFALRFEGRVVAYMNRCAHVPTEMDWRPGEFLDDERRFIVCSMHGAVYEPTTGQCIAGPCAGPAPDAGGRRRARRPGVLVSFPGHPSRRVRRTGLILPPRHIP